MPIRIKNLEIDGMKLIKPHLFEDDRGIYRKYYEKEQFRACGIDVEFTESSDIYSEKGALRGLHYQHEHSQAKLIHVLSGVLFDVALDLRRDSMSFGNYHVELMKAEDNTILYIPEGFAHGFIALADHTIFSYQCSGKYHPESAGGILWNDENLNIPWPIRDYGITDIIATEKDLTWPTLEAYCHMSDIVI